MPRLQERRRGASPPSRTVGRRASEVTILMKSSAAHRRVILGLTLAGIFAAFNGCTEDPNNDLPPRSKNGGASGTGPDSSVSGGTSGTGAGAAGGSLGGTGGMGGSGGAGAV